MKWRKKSSKLIERLIKEKISSYKFLDYYKSSSIDKFSNIPLDKYPESWKRIFFKSYSRFKKIKLPQNNSKDKLIDLIEKRRSKRNFNKYKISLKEIGYLLNGAKITNKSRNIYYDSLRAYPSAGARYPLEIYLLVFYSKDLERGVYHYNVKENSLEEMWPISIKELKNRNLFGNQNFIYNGSILFVITAVIIRSYIKYDERSFRFALIESGHLCQNILLLATSCGLKACPIGGFREKELMKFLDISEEELELPIYCVVVGK